MKIFLTSIILFISLHSYSWGPDVLVGPQATGKATVVATSAGTLYCSIPQGLTGVGGLRICVSTDMGQSWNPLTVIPGLNLIKSKLVVTGTDSVYCIYQVDSTLYTYSIAGDSSTPFTQMYVEDYDVAASPNSNSIYLFCDDAGGNNMHRYSSTDGGYTWNGSTALVASNAAHPRIYMTDARLILNYYGPVVPDTSSSIIRSAFYNETSPGQLVAGSFVDAITPPFHHRQYQPVRVNGFVWLIYTEGDSVQTLNYKLSTDDGASYNSAQTLSILNTKLFDACHYSDVTGSGLHVAFYTETPGPLKQMQYSTSTVSAPTTFSAPVAINDFTAECTDAGGQPSITAMNGDAGVIWQEDSSFISTYFDGLSATLGIQLNDGSGRLSLYPNPADESVTVRSNKNEIIAIRDVTGRLISYLNASGKETTIDISSIRPGIYFISSGSRTSKLVID